MFWSGGSQTLTLNVQTSQDLHLCTSCSQLLREFMLHRVKIQEKVGGGGKHLLPTDPPAPPNSMVVFL